MDEQQLQALEPIKNVLRTFRLYTYEQEYQRLKEFIEALDAVDKEFQVLNRSHPEIAGCRVTYALRQRTKNGDWRGFIINVKKQIDTDVSTWLSSVRPQQDRITAQMKEKFEAELQSDVVVEVSIDHEMLQIGFNLQ